VPVVLRPRVLVVSVGFRQIANDRPSDPSFGTTTSRAGDNVITGRLPDLTIALIPS